MYRSQGNIILTAILSKCIREVERMYYKRLWKDFQGFLDYRKASGYSTDNYKRTLTEFISFSQSAFPDAESISKAMIDGFLLQKAGCTVNTQAVHISVFRVFTKYLCFLGRAAYIPDEDYSLQRETYIPHIPDREELHSFFQTVDNCSLDSPAFHAGIMLPVIFRMQYCCGMRPGEPLRLRKDDVNLTDGGIYICETKNNRDRHIMMSDDLLRMCRKYDGMAGDREWFFQYADGSPVQVRRLTRLFRQCWKASSGCAEIRTRPYDLRHAFATHTLMRWIENRNDVMALLPYLSAYMGHSKISSTFYYIHLLPQRLRESSGIEWDALDEIYREEDHYEEI